MLATMKIRGRLGWWVVLTLTACNTVTMNSVPTEGGTGSNDDGNVSDDIEEACKQYFACGEGPDGFTESACRQMLIDCKATLGASDPGYFDAQVDACLDAGTCESFDACFFDLIQACLGETGGCNPDVDKPACQGDAIGACVQDEWTTFSCVDVCAADDSFYYSCGYSEEREHDVCWCLRGDPDTCALGANAICTCHECTDDQAQAFFDECVIQGSELVVCFAEQVQNDQIDCMAATEACF
jgi:hypothetical protein